MQHPGDPESVQEQKPAMGILSESTAFHKFLATCSVTVYYDKSKVIPFMVTFGYY